MASKNIKTRIKYKRDTSANWTKNDPVLLNGEIVIVDTANGETRTKTGDGTSKYSALPFDDEAMRNLVNNKVEKVTGKGLSTNDYNATEKSHVQTAYEHSQATHAPSNAEANQNAYSNVKVGTTTVSAKSATDTITLEAGDNITLTPDATNKKVTIKATNTDTHHQAKNVTTNSATGTTQSTTALTNGNVYLNLVENGTKRSSHKISGSGATTVTTDTSGNIIISSTDNNTVYTHPTSGVTAGTYKSVTVNAAGHVTAGTNPTTISGYGITDAKISSGTITLGSNTITPLTSSSNLNAAKLTGTASVSTTGNAATATKATQDGSGNVITDTYATKTELNNFLAASDAMVIKGGITGGSTGNYGALTPAANRGDCYKVTTAGKINGVAVEIGDMLICYVDNTAKATTSNYATVNANWFIVQNNVDLATQSTAGLLSATDKAKLDGITSSADSVSFTRSLTSGTKVGTITINGTGTDVYAPSAPGSASSTSSGIMKLYTGTGSNTDGTITQSAITTALNGKASSKHKHIMSDVLDLNLVEGTGFSYNEDGVTASGAYGVLAPSSGGTGTTTLYRDGIMYGKDISDSNGDTYVGVGCLDVPETNGSFLRQDHSGAPYWSTASETLTALGTIPIASGGTGATTASGALANLGALPVQDLSVNTTAPGTANYGRTLTVTSASSDKYYIGIDEFGKLWGGQAINNASSITWHPAIMNNSNNGAVSITASSFEINNATLYVHSSAIWAPWLSLKSGNTMYFYPNDQTELYAWMDKQTTGVRFCPQADAKGAIGHNNYRWNSIYSSNGTIQTSDRRKKKDISDDISVYKDILSEITPVRYRYNDIEGDKIRIGFIAQDLDSLFEKHGLDPRDFAAIRLDDVDPTDTIPDGKVYGLSYEGFVALNTALIQDLQKENAELKSRLSALEERLEDSNVG